MLDSQIARRAVPVEGVRRCPAQASKQVGDLRRKVRSFSGGSDLRALIRRRAEAVDAHGKTRDYRYENKPEDR